MVQPISDGRALNEWTVKEMIKIFDQKEVVEVGGDPVPEEGV